MAKIVFKINSLEKERQLADQAKNNAPLFEKYGVIFTLASEDVEKEYNKSQYESFMNKLETRWPVEENDFLRKIDTFFNIPPTTQFRINITNYGPLGYYNETTKDVFINKNVKTDPIGIIKHEILHILIQPYINLFKIDQKRKEEIVNQLFKILEA